MRLIADLLSLLVRGTALMMGLVGVAFSIAGLGGLFSDHLDAVNHAAPLWLAMGVGALLLGGLFARGAERLVMMALGATAVVACAVLMLPEVASAWRFKPEASRPGDLKIIQFNAWHENPTPKQSLAWVLAQNADIVVVEEAGGGSLELIKGLTAAYPYASCEKGRGCEPWIFSRRMIVARGHFGPGLPSSWAKIEDPAGAFTVVGVHFVWPVPAGPQQAQSRKLVQGVGTLDRRSLILTGDFNSTPWSFSLKRQDKAMGLRRWTRALPSWPSGQFSRVAAAPAPFLPIDHVYTGQAWRAVKVERGPAVGSDHRPVMVTLRRSAK
jgi:endonuclease/exonuclease/phosphatase (EEP) superfamily protein YafD